jgi:hypothetical protein
VAGARFGSPHILLEEEVFGHSAQKRFDGKLTPCISNTCEAILGAAPKNGPGEL